MLLDERKFQKNKPANQQPSNPYILELSSASLNCRYTRLYWIYLGSLLGHRIEMTLTQDLIYSYPIKKLNQDEIDFNENSIQRQIMTEYQCARDTFIILGENKESWLDLYTTFFHTSVQTITCKTCGWKSVQEQDTVQLFMDIPCPPNNTSMKFHLEKVMNTETDIEYRCQICRATKDAFLQHQINTEASSKFFIISVNRTEINYFNKAKKTSENITLIDSNECPRIYQPISIIYHEGGAKHRVKSAQHYLCDVWSREDNKRFRTSDSSQPEPLSKQKVTQLPYIILFERKS